MTYREIVEAWAGECGVSYSVLVGPGRRKDLSRSRQLAAYILREHTGLSLTQIGRELGGRDHTTVLHSLERAKLLLDDEELHDRVHRFVRLLRPEPEDGTPLERFEGLGHVPPIRGLESSRDTLERLLRNGSTPH